MKLIGIFKHEGIFFLPQKKKKSIQKTDRRPMSENFNHFFKKGKYPIEVEHRERERKNLLGLTSNAIRIAVIFPIGVLRIGAK